MIPDKIKVGHMIYDIDITDEPLLLENKQCKGIIDYEQGKIRLAGDSVHGEQARVQTLWYEIFHAFIRDRDIEVNDEEYLVEALSKCMAAFCLDNGMGFKEEK